MTALPPEYQQTENMYMMEEDEMDIKIEPAVQIEGQRRNTNLIVYDGFAYHCNYTTDKKRYLQCAQRNPLGCSARATVPLDGDIGPILLKKQHNHAPDPHLIQRATFIQELKKRVVVQAGTLKSIYDQACLEFPNVSALVAFQSIETTLRRARATTQPRHPANLLDYGDLIALPEWRRFAQTTQGRPFYSASVAGSDGSVGIIFANPDFIEKLSPATEIHVDASFIMEPCITDAKYMFSVHAIMFGHSHAILYALISAKTYEMYHAVLGHLKHSAPLLSPSLIITDYERPLQLALREVYPKASVQGSYFHYAQHVYQKMSLLGIATVAEDNNDIRNIIKMVLSLALLPKEKIPVGINTIEKVSKTRLVSDMAIPLFDYLDQVWWADVTPELFSVFNTPAKVNNNIEMFHKTIRQRFHTITNAWTFTEKLKEIECLTFRDFELLQGGHAICRERKTKLLTHDEKLTRAWRMLETGRLPTFPFLERAIEIVKNIENVLRLWKDDYEEVEFIHGYEITGKEIKPADRKKYTDEQEDRTSESASKKKKTSKSVYTPPPKAQVATKTKSKSDSKSLKNYLGEKVCISCEDEDWEARCKLSPCNHSPFCSVCAMRLVSEKNKCPVCRATLKGFTEME